MVSKNLFAVEPSTILCIVASPKKVARKIQSQKTQGFCVTDFVTLSDEGRPRSKVVLLFNTVKS